MSRIELKHIDKFYGDNHVLKDINLTIEDGDFMTLLGPSGCGKTTTLRVVSGLERPQGGIMTIDGVEMINADTAYYAEPSKRGLNLVFQSYALWPHMTVRENICFGLKIQKLPKEEMNKRLMDSLKMMRIEEYIDRYPNELSGGQQQRVAIARAVASNPKLLLLDEPLSNLDARLRIDMRSELQRIHKQLGTTIIYVTHDQVEALTMSTKIALFKEGEINQVATPMELYLNPIDLQAADFIGNPRINFVEATAHTENGKLVTESELGHHEFKQDDLTDEPFKKDGSEFKAVLAMRPEMVQIYDTKEDEDCFEAEVYANQPAGSETLVSLRVGKTEFLCKQIGLVEHKVDENVYVHIPKRTINVYDAESTRLIKRTH